MTNTNEDGVVGELVDAAPATEPLRSAFASAMRAIMEGLPPCRARDLAVREIMGAHQRVEELLARHRTLN